MHNGTIEYTSRDAHQGVPTMRGDIEILAYNLIEWAGGKLPWVVKNLLAKPVDVQNSKEEFMKSTDKSLKGCFGSTPVPTQLAKFLKYLESMKYDTKPDYTKIRGMFEAGMKELGKKNSGVLEFGSSKATSASAPATKKKAPAGRPNFDNKLGDSPKKPAEDPQPEQVKRAPGKRNVVRKTYVESGSDTEEEVKTKPKKAAASKAKKAPEPAVVEDTRPAKRNRERKQYVIDSESSDGEEEPPVKTKSPQKKSRVQVTSPTRSASKENHEASGSSMSPPEPKKTKPDEGKEEKSSIKDDIKKSAAKGSITLKSRTNSSKTKKTIQLNFNLDVSLDSDLVVVVNRKDKKKDDKKDENDAASSASGVTQAGVYKGKQAKSPTTEVTPNRAGVYKGKQAKTPWSIVQSCLWIAFIT